MREFLQNNELTYTKNPYYGENKFVGAAVERRELPTYDEVRDRLPFPVFEGHDDYVACYEYAWRTAFSNLCHAVDGTGFVSDFIDTAFNGCIFMWDSSFILMFTKYADRVFPFQRTLDNFYALQHKDGFICREINEHTGNDRFARHDPSSTGPNVMPWCEWNYYLNFGDKERLERVYFPLRAYHLWLRKNRTWRDGTYFSSGWGCGMDNVPRMSEGEDIMFSNGHMVWLDTCLQQIISCDVLIKMNEIIGKDDTSDLLRERTMLCDYINERMWDADTCFYYDLWSNGQLNMVKHVGAYWALLADIVPRERLERFVSHLENKSEFDRPCAIPSLSADHSEYNKLGDYWRGGVWAPTNYMVLEGLYANGYGELAYRIAEKYLKNVVEVYNKTGTLWENYSPESASEGTPAKRDFVGWTGLAPISVFFEYVLGIKADAENGVIIWNIRRTERHGILRYPFGKATVDLICESREATDSEPRVSVSSDSPVTVKLYWDGGEKTVCSH